MTHLCVGKKDIAVVDLPGDCLKSKHVFLGDDELDRYVSGRKIRIYIVTWNLVHTAILPVTVSLLASAEKQRDKNDVYVFGSQENHINKRVWERQLQTAIGFKFVMLKSFSTGSLHIALFIRRDLFWFCLDIDSAVVLSRVWTPFKTKGSVALSFTIFGSKFLFINSHFISGENCVGERINTYKKTVEELRFPSDGSTLKGSPHIMDWFDRIFWFGDMNFRLRSPESSAESFRQRRDSDRGYEDILKTDELLNLMTSGDIFVGFMEHKISFAPTYKFHLNSHHYTDQRRPSYTDRILYHGKESIKCLAYNCIAAISQSDHKPVYGTFETTIKPSNDSHIGELTFDRQLFIDVYKGREINGATSSVCSIL